jgi:hypothetical protein
MRKFLTALAIAALLLFKPGVPAGAGDTDPSLLHFPNRSKSYQFHFKTAGDGSGNYTTVTQVKVDPRFRSYIVDIDLLAERIGGTSTDDDVKQAASQHCAVLYTYAPSGPVLTAPHNDVSGGTNSENEQGCQFPIWKLCDDSPCIWEEQRNRSNLIHYELTNQGDIDISIEEPSGENKVIVFTGTVTVTEVPDLSGIQAPSAVKVLDPKRSADLSAYTVTTNNTDTPLFRINRERDTSYVLDVELIAQYITGDDSNHDHQTSYANCQATYDYSNGGNWGLDQVLCSYPKRHLCREGECVWGTGEDIFDTTPPTFTLDGDNILVKVRSDDSEPRRIVWFAKVKVRTMTIHVVTTTTSTTLP